MNNNSTDFRDPNCLKYDHVVQVGISFCYGYQLITVGLRGNLLGGHRHNRAQRRVLWSQSSIHHNKATQCHLGLSSV